MNADKTARLTAELRKQIFRGEVLPSSALLSERQLSGLYGVSRSTVRSALNALQQQGLVEVERGKAARCKNLLEPYFDLQFEGFGNNLAAQLQVMEARAMLEGEAAYHAATRATDDELLKIAEEYQSMVDRSRGQTTLAKAKADLRFHMMIAESSHHLLIISFSQMFYSRFFNAIYGVLNRTLKNYGRYPDGISAQHRSINEALQQRDAKKAQDCAREHILYTKRLLE